MARQSEREPSLAQQGRALQALKARIEAIHAQAEERSQAEPRHAAAHRAQAEAMQAPLIAQGMALRDRIIERARRRARSAWRAAYSAGALIVLLAIWQLLRG